MVNLICKGKMLFTSRMMQELCHITFTKPDNSLLQENEDYIILNLEELMNLQKKILIRIINL